MDYSGLLSELNPDALSEKMEELFPRFSIDFSDFFSHLLAGEMKEAFSLLLASLKGGLAAEAAGMRNLFLSILMIGILSSLFTVAAQAFKNRQTADIAHFIACLTMLLTVLSVFSQAADTAGRLLENILLFVRLFLPTFMLALGFSSGTVTAAGYYELILLLIYGVEQLLMSVGLPAADICMALVVMNGIWEEGKLSAFIDLIRKAVSGGLKVLLGCVTGIGLLQSMVTPVLESLKISSAAKFLSSIPGLGGLAEGTAQLLIGSAVLIKNGLGAAAILLLLLLCAVPFLKLFLYGLILKLCAALLGLSADRRLTGCIDRAGDAVFLLLRIVFTATACFLILFAIITCLAGTVR
ncbi:MAG TPA: stage III sporulation protein AE [Candidatus Eisenbergiella stercorigallinarum]|uniref:Stage III sporulation protein AE n=1 Tax=Candidatus Eisenbergiella stercorigallinarum TaxID=2838557 RepID=A0A9D2QXN5_9FIRM|nr:stage III sporulation protein AE [Candidatus Eisenbergiella stercorigallinarum]